MNILITGATGFVGHHAIRYFAGKYSSVTALSRKPQASTGNIKYAVTDYSVGSLFECAKGCDAVLHLAAGRPNNSSPEELQNNVLLDFRVLKAAYELKITNVIFLSSRGIYGKQALPWTEKTAADPDNYYALAKLQSELVANYFIAQGLNIKILRIAQVFGLGEYKGSAISTFIERAYYDQSIDITVSGIQREYLYIKDLLSAFDACLNKPEISGLFNVGSQQSLTIKEIVESIVSGFNSQSAINTDVKKNFNENSLMDSSLFRDTFGWRSQYTFYQAVEDIKKSLNNHEISKYYGLSGHR